MIEQLTVSTLAEHPALVAVLRQIQQIGWAPFMLAGEVVERHWPAVESVFAPFQFVLHDEAGIAVAYGNSVPLVWDGSVGGLPAGWDDALERAVADYAVGREPTTLCALAAVVHPARQGQGLSAEVLMAMRGIARAHGLKTLIAPVRPSLKSRYPLTPIEHYLAWRHANGLPFDPWLRVHARLGASMLGVAPASMRIAARVARWERWTGMAMPESGDYIVSGALTPVHVDRLRDEALYIEPNVWMLHGPLDSS